MKILFLGDVVGKIGRKSLFKSLSFIIKEYKIDFVICNVENVSGGYGITLKHFNELSKLPINAMTLGNHYKDKIQIIDFIENDKIIRPYNILNLFPGCGSRVYLCKNKKICVSNILGNVYMNEKVDDPYLSILKIIKDNPNCIHVIDFHAEATGEKKSVAYALDGKINALLGTHTHVQTNDEILLPNKTAYISDVGMCGSYNSILGNEPKSVINKIVLHKEGKFKILEDDDLMINGVIIDIDDVSNLTTNIVKLNLVNGKEK